MTQATVRHLSVLGYAGGFTHWVYKDTATPLATMLEPGFFTPVREMVATGDVGFLAGLGHTAQRVFILRPDGQVALAQVF